MTYKSVVCQMSAIKFAHKKFAVMSKKKELKITLRTKETKNICLDTAMSCGQFN